MFIPAPAVVSVLVVLVLLGMSPVAETDAAEIDPDVDIDSAVIDPVAFSSTMFVMFSFAVHVDFSKMLCLCCQR